jgi:hypothetical protein
LILFGAFTATLWTFTATNFPWPLIFKTATFEESGHDHGHLATMAVLPGPAKPSLSLQLKMMAIFSPFIATQAILLVQLYICAQIYSYNRQILPKILFIRTCMLIFLK